MFDSHNPLPRMTYACTSQEPFQPAAPNALIKRRVREVRGAKDELSPATAEEEPEEDCEMHKDKRPQSWQPRS